MTNGVDYKKIFKQVAQYADEFQAMEDQKSGLKELFDKAFTEAAFSKHRMFIAQIGHELRAATKNAAIVLTKAQTDADLRTSLDMQTVKAVSNYLNIRRLGYEFYLLKPKYESGDVLWCKPGEKKSVPALLLQDMFTELKEMTPTGTVSDKTYRQMGTDKHTFRKCFEAERKAASHSPRYQNLINYQLHLDDKSPRGNRDVNKNNGRPSM